MAKCNAPLHFESALACSKCGEVICPECAVQTPVGYRCQECAKLGKLPTFQIDSKHYTIAGLVGFGMAVVMGVLWMIGFAFLPFGYVNIIIAPAIGMLIGEVISRSVNRKRGLGLAVIGGSAMVLCYLLAAVLPWGLRFHIIDIAAVIIAVPAAITQLR